MEHQQFAHRFTKYAYNAIQVDYKGSVLEAYNLKSELLFLTGNTPSII